MEKLLSLLEDHARLTNAQLAAMAGMTEAEVDAAITKYENAGIICGYKALIDWEKTEKDVIIARIELKVIPKSTMGFEEIAHTIAKFSEVSTVYLMSGGYDLALTVTGKSFQEIALFVAYKLAPLDSVQSTATHFVLRKYKDRGVLIGGVSSDERVVFE